MKRTALLILFLNLCACAASGEAHKNVETTVHKIYCSGSDSDWDTCYEDAHELCAEKGFDVLEKYKDQGALAAYASARVLPDRRLTIRCKY